MCFFFLPKGTAPSFFVFALFRRNAKPQQHIPLETWLADAHAHYQALARQQAEAFALAGRPFPDEVSPEPYFQAIHAQYTNLLLYCHHYLKSGMLLLKAKQMLNMLKTMPGPQSPEAKQLSNAFLHHMEQVMYVQSIERHIESMYLETIAIFIQANTLARADQKFPKCFFERQPMLERMFARAAR